MSKKQEELEALKKLEGKKSPIEESLIDGKNKLFHDIDTKLLGYEGEYYSNDTIYRVSTLTIDDIKIYSSMDETDVESVTNGINHIIENTLKVIKNNKFESPSKVIYEHDKLNFLLLINRYTGGTNNIIADVVCEENHQNEEIIRPEIIKYDDVTEKAKSLYSKELGLFVIKPKNVNTELRFRPLTIHETDRLKEYAKSTRAKKEAIDEIFLKLSGFFMHDNDSVDKAYQKYLKLTSDKILLSIMLDFVENQAKFTTSTRIEGKCKTCGRLNPTIFNLRGTKNLFLVPNVAEEY